VRTRDYNRLMAMQAKRRSVLKGAGMGAAAAMGGAAGLRAASTPAFAQSDLRAEILKIPGVGMGSPTDADWQKVGELCLGQTKETVQEGEFAGVELTFMGLNNQNLHNLLFRGFLRPWENYTGASITWIDLAQADYNPRLQQAIATGTVDFDIIEMGAPFEGDVCGKGLASGMPDWVPPLIEMDDYVGYLQAPVGTWDGKTYRISVDGDCHTFNYRTDYFADESLAEQWEAEGHEGPWEVPTTWQKVQEVTKFLAGKTKMYVPTGCARCLKTGFNGRKALFELLDVTDELRDVILREPSIQAMKKVIESGLFTTLAQSGWKYVADGSTSLDEVDRVAGQG